MSKLFEVVIMLATDTAIAYGVWNLVFVELPLDLQPLEIYSAFVLILALRWFRGYIKG